VGDRAARLKSPNDEIPLPDPLPERERGQILPDFLPQHLVQTPSSGYKWGMTSPFIAASVLAADFGRLDDDLSAMDAAGVDLFHWDMMDGHFVPNISFGPAVMKALRGTTKKPFDVHLMVTNPIQWIDAVIDAGADHISFHVEAVADPMLLIKKIKDKNIGVGLALNPDTIIDNIASEIFTELNRVVVMTVNPGFGGQKFIDQSMKIKMIRAQYPHLDIMVDGGVNIETAAIVIEAGATTLVTGSALFNASDKAKFISTIKGGVQ